MSQGIRVIPLDECDDHVVHRRLSSWCSNAEDYMMEYIKHSARKHFNSRLNTSKPETAQTTQRERYEYDTVDQISSPVNVPKEIPHHEVSLIVRGDLVHEGAALAYDTEKLQCHVNGSKKPSPISGDFALVDLQGRIVMWCYIFREDVCAYNTCFTGLDKDKVNSGITQDMFVHILSKILKKNILVGAATKQDFHHLGLCSSNLPGGCSSFDIQSFFKDEKGQAISMQLLVEYLTGEKYQDGMHSSLEDARMTAMAYNKMLELKSQGRTTFSCPDIYAFRKAKKVENKLNRKDKPKWERCKCFTKETNTYTVAQFSPLDLFLMMVIVILTVLFRNELTIFVFKVKNVLTKI